MEFSPAGTPPQYQRQRFAGIKNPEVFTGKDFGIWRRRRDLNPRDGFPPYSLSRGAPSATWVLLHAKYRIHLEKMWRREWDSNPRMLPHRRFSRPVPSTTRTSLHVRSPAKCKKDDTTLFAHCQLPPAIFFCLPSIIIKRTETQTSRLCVFSLLQPHRTEVRLTGK